MFKKLTKSLNPELEPNTQGSNLNKLLHELKQQIRNNSPPHPIPKITSQFQAKPTKRVLGQQPQIKHQQRDEFYQLSIVDTSIKTKQGQTSPHMQPVVKQATQREIVIDQVDPSPGATSITHRSLSSASSDSFLPELDRSLLVSSRRQSNASTQNGKFQEDSTSQVQKQSGSVKRKRWDKSDTNLPTSDQAHGIGNYKKPLIHQYITEILSRKQLNRDNPFVQPRGYFSKRNSQLAPQPLLRSPSPVLNPEVLEKELQTARESIKKCELMITQITELRHQRSQSRQQQKLVIGMGRSSFDSSQLIGKTNLCKMNDKLSNPRRSVNLA